MAEFVSDTGANAADSSYMYACDLYPPCFFNDFHSYDAIGTIEHRGMLYGGHYISYTKHPVDGMWCVRAIMRGCRCAADIPWSRYLNDDASVTVVSADVVKRSCAYVVFYRRRPMHDVEQRRAHITAAVSAASAAAARSRAAAAAVHTRSSLPRDMPVSALDASNLVSDAKFSFNRILVCFQFKNCAGVGTKDLVIVAAGGKSLH